MRRTLNEQQRRLGRVFRAADDLLAVPVGDPRWAQRRTALLTTVDEVHVAADDAMMMLSAGSPRDLDALTSRTYQFAVAAALAGLVATAVVGRRVVLPLRRLSESAERVAAGDLAIDPLALGRSDAGYRTAPRRWRRCIDRSTAAGTPNGPRR